MEAPTNNFPASLQALVTYEEDKCIIKGQIHETEQIKNPIL